MHKSFFFNDTATTEIYTLSLHDALPISVELDLVEDHHRGEPVRLGDDQKAVEHPEVRPLSGRSEEHTSELQSLAYLVCRLLLEKKKNACVNEIPLLFAVTHVGPVIARTD